jgi:hypothetical protein
MVQRILPCITLKYNTEKLALYPGDNIYWAKRTDLTLILKKSHPEIFA